MFPYLRALAVVFAWELPFTDLAGEHSEQNVIYDSIGLLRVAEQSPDLSATCFTRMVDRSLVRTGMRMSRAGNPVARASLALVASIVAPLSLGAPAASAGPRAAPPATIAVRADTLTITVPNSVNFGADSQGGSISASLGTVTVADARIGIPPWTATVSATDFTLSGSPTQTIPKANIAYWSGAATVSTGGGTRVPGQATAAQKVALSSSATAFSGRKTAAILQTTAWAPTIVITIPSSAVSGTYNGSIIHSVA
ncbi:hypothetical protein AB0H88_30285 [Nonomuraea sp. NPDC050680]|uniref:hypothetical protein n=1 Tax=Nonomuraea sp. NPDC050680 TaxID=3154630 RepID=UPI0033DE5684